MTYNQIMREYEGYFVVASVTERDANGKACDFLVLDTCAKKAKALELLERFTGIKDNVLLFPVFNEHQISFGKLTRGTVIIEPLMSPSEDARFFRTYYGL